MNTDVLAIREKALGPDHPEMLCAERRTAPEERWTYRAQGQYAEVEPLDKRADSFQISHTGA